MCGKEERRGGEGQGREGRERREGEGRGREGKGGWLLFHWALYRWYMNSKSWLLLPSYSKEVQCGKVRGDVQECELLQEINDADSCVPLVSDHLCVCVHVCIYGERFVPVASRVQEEVESRHNCGRL